MTETLDILVSNREDNKKSTSKERDVNNPTNQCHEVKVIKTHR